MTTRMKGEFHFEVRALNDKAAKHSMLTSLRLREQRYNHFRFVFYKQGLEILLNESLGSSSYLLT